MNTRIQELTRNAFMLAHEANDLHEQEHGEELSLTEFDNIFNQKFAQLIIEECASKVDWILAEGGKTQGDLIREHFGVKL